VGRPGLSRRRLLALLPGLSLALALAACGGPSAPNGDQARQISVWTLDLAPRFNPFMQRVIREWQALHPGYTVRWTDVPWSSVERKLLAAVFARTAPDLELDYDAGGLELGRQHRDAVTAAGFLDDLAASVAWIRDQPDLAGGPIGCVGFCFGGHLALLAATLPAIGATCAFYGARVSSFRPGGGPPSLELVPAIQGRLLCFCGDEDGLIPESDVLAIEQELEGSRHRLIRVPGAGHGYMCEAREAFREAAAAEGWRQMLALFAQDLGDGR
jgi:carboxymethylenebutenolidase